MKIYFDNKSCEEFYDIIKSYGTEHPHGGKSALYELLSYLRNHCDIRFLPLDNKDLTNKQKCNDWNLLGKYVDIDTQHRRARYIENFTLKDKHRENTKVKETTPFPSNDQKADNLRKWLTIGDTPYSEIDEDDNIKKFVSAYFAADTYPSLKARDLSSFTFRKFLDGCLVENKFATAKLRYTGNKKDWSSLINCTLPISEIIIVDPFLFVEKDKNIDSTKKLISQLIGTNENVQITFVCKPPTLKKDGLEPNYGGIYKDLHDNHQTCKFLFVLHNSIKNLPESLHDRYIITNNGLYISGHSFVNYFPHENSSCKARGSMGFAMHSFLDHDNELVLRDIIYNNLSVILENSIKGELLGDKFESDLLKLENKKVLSTNEWNSLWDTELYESKIVPIQCRTYKDKYKYFCDDCFLGTGEKEYTNGTKVKINNITLNKKEGKQRFYATIMYNYE